MFKFLKFRDNNKAIKMAGHFFLVLILVAILILPYFVFAEEVQGPPEPPPSLKANLDTLRGEAGYTAATETTAAELVGTVVNGFLGVIGIIFVILMIYAGHNWMTAAGNEEKVSTAQTTLLRASIGLAIIVGSYAIWKFVIDKLFQG